MNNDFEKQLDKLLTFFVEKGADYMIPIQYISAEFQTSDLYKMLAVLEHLKFITSPSFKDSVGETRKYPYLYALTPAGIYFASNSSFVDEAIVKKKERQLFNFKHFIMG